MAPEIVYILFLSVTSEEHFYAIAPISLVIIRFIPSKQDDDDMEISTDFRTHTHTRFGLFPSCKKWHILGHSLPYVMCSFAIPLSFERNDYFLLVGGDWKMGHRLSVMRQDGRCLKMFF